MKVVINICYGGFGLSHKAMLRYAELKGIKLYWRIDEISKKYYGDDPNADGALVHYYTVQPEMENSREFVNEHYFSNSGIERHDPDLVKVVDELGRNANGYCASLHIVEIPDNTDYVIEEYDGNEHIAEKHREWR